MTKNSSRVVGQQKGIGESRRSAQGIFRKIPSYKHHLVWTAIMTPRDELCLLYLSLNVVHKHNTHYCGICTVTSLYILPHFLPSVTLPLGPVSSPVQSPSHWAMFRIVFKHCLKDRLQGRRKGCERWCFGCVAWL